MNNDHEYMRKILNKDEFRKYAVKGMGINGSHVDTYLNHLNGSYVNNVENMTRSIIEERPTRFAEIDVFSRLMMDRIIFLGTPIDDYIGNIITAQLLFLESTDSRRDITMYINSPGGSVYAGLGIYDTMCYIKPDVSTICVGLAASMGQVLLCAGQKGKRVALKHARVMMHQPSGGAGGQSSDIEINAKLILALRDELYHITAEHTGKTYEQIYEDSDRDFWLRADEAKEYGLIDEVLTRQK